MHQKPKNRTQFLLETSITQLIRARGRLSLQEGFERGPEAIEEPETLSFPKSFVEDREVDEGIVPGEAVDPSPDCMRELEVESRRFLQAFLREGFEPAISVAEIGDDCRFSRNACVEDLIRVRNHGSVWNR